MYKLGLPFLKVASNIGSYNLGQTTDIAISTPTPWHIFSCTNTFNKLLP